jgi:hypothetical protein
MLTVAAGHFQIDCDYYDCSRTFKRDAGQLP